MTEPIRGHTKSGKAITDELEVIREALRHHLEAS